MKYIVKNCPCYWHIGEDDGYSLENLKNCEDDDNCIMKQVVRLCKDVKEKDPIVAERDKRTGEIISICGWTENPVYNFVQKILDLLEIEEVNEKQP